MRCFVASDDIAMANQLSELMNQLGHECPASHILRLDQIIPRIDGIVRGEMSSRPSRVTGNDGNAANAGAAENIPRIILVVLPPDSELALAVVRELRRRVSANILAVGPATDTRLVLRSFREGASEYIDQADLRTELTEAIARRTTTEKPGRAIAIMSPGGGTGGSTIAVNTAIVLAQKFKGCALLDLNLEAGDLAPLLDLKPPYTLVDICLKIERLDFSLLQGCLMRHSSGVQLLAAPLRISDALRVTPEAVGQILALAERNFPFVMFDLDHSYRPEQQAAMRLADLLVLVMRLDFISLRNTRKTLDFLQEIGISRERILIVANRCGQSGEISVTQAEESLGIKMSLSVPEDQKAVNRAANNGVPVVLQSPSSRTSRAIVELATLLAEKQLSSI